MMLSYHPIPTKDIYTDPQITFPKIKQLILRQNFNKDKAKVCEVIIGYKNIAIFIICLRFVHKEYKMCITSIIQFVLHY